MAAYKLSPYLQPSSWIDADHPAVLAKAKALAEGVEGVEGPQRARTITARCYEFVRDEIEHSLDFQRSELTCRASDVLRHRTGYCYAKSHLLAALLRANGIAAGLCYQRLSFGDGGEPYCLHGLNAVYLDDLSPEPGWYRLDARGNKPGVDAAFCPPREQLAFAIKEAQEADLPEIWAEPLDVIVQALTRDATPAQIAADLPDIQLARFGYRLRA